MGPSVATDLAAFLAARRLSHIDLAGRTNLAALVSTLLDEGRVRLLGELKSLGVTRLADRQALANELTRAVREGLLSKA
eukprot:4427182-Prymnesium_polylepis.1